jgi:hypothetical protein
VSGLIALFERFFKKKRVLIGVDFRVRIEVENSFFMERERSLKKDCNNPDPLKSSR